MECTDPRPLVVESIKELERKQQLSSAMNSSGSGARPQYHNTDVAALLKDRQERVAKHVARYGSGAEGIRKCFVGRPKRNMQQQQNDGNDEDNADTRQDLSNDEEDFTDVFDYEQDLLKVQAPMVRCSRPPFRKLCRLWGTTLSYTHMILADCFVRSEAARQVDFALFSGEDMLITQFAAKCGPTLAQAAAIVAPYTDGIDINCGCPQKWAMKDGYGSALLEKPELVADMVSCVSNSSAGVPCVVKMRVYDDLQKSVEFARRAEKAGAAWLTVHGRTPSCTSSAAVRHEAIKLVKESVNIPVVANGGIRDPETAIRLSLESSVGGVMSGQGLLDNPACFDKGSSCFAEVVKRQWDRMPMLGAAYKQQQREAVAAGVGYSETGEAAAAAAAPNRANPVGVSVASGIPAPMFWDDCYNAHFTLSSHPNSMPPNGTTGVCCPPDHSHAYSAVADVPPIGVISDFCRLALHTELPYKTTQHHLLMMAHKYLSPAERIYVGEQPSLLGIVEYFREQGLYVPDGRYTPAL